MSKIVYIYTLLHPITKDIRYVGKTTCLQKRLENHLFKAKDFTGSRKIYNWIQSLTSKDLKPVIIEVEKCSEETWPDRERYWISYYKGLGCDLCNLTDGGESNYGFRPTEDTKRKMALAKTGKKYPQQLKDKIRESLSRRVLCVDTGQIFGSIKEAAINSNVPKTTFHRKFKNKERINGVQFIQWYNTTQTPKPPTRPKYRMCLIDIKNNQP